MPRRKLARSTPARKLPGTRKERLAFLHGYRMAHRERIADLRRVEQLFDERVATLRAELTELHQFLMHLGICARRPPSADRKPPAVN